jgi:hypothetical protein
MVLVMSVTVIPDAVGVQRTHVNRSVDLKVPKMYIKLGIKCPVSFL